VENSGYYLDYAGIEKAWRDGVSSTDIAGLFGTAAPYVRTLAKRNGWGARGKRRGVEDSKVNNNAILDLWCSGVSTDNISSLTGVGRSGIASVIARARKRGDVRAVNRPRGRRPIKRRASRGITSQPSLIRRIVGWLRA